MRGNDGGPLAGGGEMGALMRSIDWSRSPLGPVDRWPTSLRTTVGIMLGNRFPTMIWWSREFIQVYNDGYRPILGDKHPASMGRSGKEVWAEIWHIVGPMASGILEGGPATWSEHLLLPMRRRGFLEEAYFTFSYSPIPDDDGRVGGVLVTVQETTDQVLDARQLRALRDLGARTSAAAKSAESACAAAAEVLSGYAADVPFALLYLTDPDSKARLVSTAGLPDGPPKEGSWPLAEAAATGEPVLVRDLGRFGPLPGGPWPEGPHTAIVVPIPSADRQKPHGFLVAGTSSRRLLDERYAGFFRLAADQIATSITNARAREEERRRAEALAALDRAKTNFFSNVSHEFRTPLTLMLGPMEDALAAPGQSLSGQALELTYRNTLRLLTLVNALLDFSRIEAGRMQATFVPTDLAAFTAELASVFRAATERAGLRLVVELQAARAPLYVDRSLWEKVVLNLLSNAFKFTFEGEIGVTAVDRGDTVEFRFRDTGVGVAPDQLGRLFERFHRVEGTRSRTHEGTGIGLSLVQEIVRLHGGDIRVESELGRGTTFTIALRKGSAHLPPERLGAAPEQPADSRAASTIVQQALRWLQADGGEEAEPETAPAPAVAPGSRILLADDNRDLRDYVGRLLRQQGWTVDCVEDGEAALARLRGQPYDLVLSDVMMPRLDGLGLLAAIRQDPALQTTPVILVSARAGEESRVGALQAGADDYLVKPFSGRELVARVGSQLALGLLRRERAMLEQRAQLAQGEAELQREHVRWLLAQMPLPIVILRGRDMVVELANDQACRVWGRTPEQVLEKPLVQALPELRGQPFIPLLERVYDTGVSHVGKELAADLQYPGRAKPERVYFNFVYAPRRNLNHEIDGVLVIATDVTAQVTAREHVDALRREAESANRAKDEFMAMLGHELRNPLSPIVTALQLLRLRGDRSREHDLIERQVNHLVRLVDDLLDVARITQGKIELRKQRVELADIVLRAVESVSPLLERRRIKLQVEVEPQGLVVDGDPDRLAQVFLNLLTNAAKYSETDTRVRVTARREGGRIRTSVADQGIGIAADMLDTIFDTFVQHRQSIDRAGGGLGLGLSIVRSLVALHGGQVSASSPGLGQGSTFTVDLPGAAPIEVEDAGASARPVVHAGQRLPRVLVVDDNEDAAIMLADALRTLGFEVRTAHDGPRAVALAGEFRPDVALLDIGLPMMDGYEVARRLREAETTAGVTLVALTGYGQESDRRRSEEAGFSAHLVKPIDLDALAKLLMN
jgi:signal transduction histidine kinase